MSDQLAFEELPQPEHEGRVNPESLETDGDNPNEMTDEQFGLLCDRMRQNGWLGGPIITNTDGLIADGEHRWRAAQEIGLAEVPVRQFDIDDATRRLWRQELNKIHGEHDDKRDALEYDYLLDAGKSDEVHDLVNAADEDLDELLAKIKMEQSRPAQYDYDPEHNVYFEDCVEGMQERVPDDSVDAVITDPPYGIDLDLSDTMGATGVTHSGDLQNDGLEDALSLFTETARELSRVLKPDGHAYIFASWKTYDKFRDILQAHGFDVRNCIVWAKTTPNNQPSFGTGGVNYGTQHEFILYAVHEDGSPRSLSEVMSDIIRHKHQTEGNEHPTEKPVGLLEVLINQSTEEEETVLDPFMGSGTTAVAAIQNDREYIGFEIDEENYRDVIERRIGEAKRQREAGVNTD